MTYTTLPLRGICRGAAFAGTSALALTALTATLPAATTVELEPMVVVSTRTPLGLDRVTPSVSYVSAEQIATWQDRQLTDTLRREPGMTLWSNGGLGSISSLSVRGTESNHTAMFIDGRRLSPGFGNQYDIEFLSPANASSVEIQRGPSSVQYGSSNIGGVIDTRLQSGLGAGAATGKLFSEIGSHDYRQAGIQTRLGNETAGFSFSGTTQSSENDRPNDGFDQNLFSSRFDYVINDRLQLELVTLGFDNRKELPGSTGNPSPYDQQDTSSWLISPGVRYLSDELSAHLFYSRAERNSDIFEVNAAYDYSGFPPTHLGDFPISNRIEVISDELNLQIDYSLPGDSLLTLGTVFRNDEILNSNLNTYSPLDPATPFEESFQQLGLFGQLLWMLGDDTELHLGVRHDDYSDFDGETTGNLTLVHHLRDSGTSLFAKIATSYAPPSAVDLAYDYDTSTPLNAERSKSYELGIRQSLLDDKLKGSIVLFRNEIDDLLSYEPSTYDTFNIEQATTQGIETSISYQATDKLELALGYTYLQATADRLDDPRTGGFTADPANDVPLARRPRHLAQASASYRFTDDFRAGIQAVGQFHREDINPASYLQEQAEDFVILRLISSWKLNDDWSLSGRIENLLDEAYSSAAGYPALGRTAYFGADYSF